MKALTLSFLTLAGLAIAAPAFATPDNTAGMAMLGAAVAADGTLLSGSGVTGITHMIKGGYQVRFDRDVSLCFYNTTVTDGPASTTAEPDSSDEKAVLVSLFDVNNSPENIRFYLLIYCSQ